MKPSEIFEGENSGLMQAYNIALAKQRQETYDFLMDYKFQTFHAKTALIEGNQILSQVGEDKLVVDVEEVKVAFSKIINQKHE